MIPRAVSKAAGTSGSFFNPPSNPCVSRVSVFVRVKLGDPRIASWRLEVINWMNLLVFLTHDQVKQSGDPGPVLWGRFDWDAQGWESSRGGDDDDDDDDDDDVTVTLTNNLMLQRHCCLPTTSSSLPGNWELGRRLRSAVCVNLQFLILQLSPLNTEPRT